eukprot:gene7103-11266_t
MDKENKFSDQEISGRRPWSKFPIRTRAHVNPLSDEDYDHPSDPSQVKLETMFPKLEKNDEIKVLDVGCAYGGYLVTVSPLLETKLCLGIEIRRKVAQYSQDRIKYLREESPGKYQNIWVEQSNAMKYLPHYFKKGQLEKIFFMFPDPHFKTKNYKRRIIGPALVPVYAYVLKKGGLIYTITDYQDLGNHMQKYLDESPLFERLKENEYKDDPLVPFMSISSEDAHKQKYKEKYLAIYLQGKLSIDQLLGRKENLNGVEHVDFENTCSKEVKHDINVAISSLHSFEYGLAMKEWRKVLEKDSDCAIGYWGMAMCYHTPIWFPPSTGALKAGLRQITMAEEKMKVRQVSTKEKDFIKALKLFFNNYEDISHQNRTVKYHDALRKLYYKHSQEKDCIDCGAFYGLMILGKELVFDKPNTPNRHDPELRVAHICKLLLLKNPYHPGCLHYIIHAFEQPELAAGAENEARLYSKIHFKYAHALHMPSHTYSLIGDWAESVDTNMKSNHKDPTPGSGSSVHAIDYAILGLLNMGQIGYAKEIYESVPQIRSYAIVQAYHYISIPARLLFETKQWKECLKIRDYVKLPQLTYEFQNVMIYYVQSIGAFFTKNLELLKESVQKLNEAHNVYVNSARYKVDNFPIRQKFEIMYLTGKPLLEFLSGNRNSAIELMKKVADKEAEYDRSAINPAPVFPAQEIVGILLIQDGKLNLAIKELETSLKVENQNRFNTFYYLGKSYLSLGNKNQAIVNFKKLVGLCDEKLKFCDYEKPCRNYKCNERKEIIEARNIINSQ